MATSARPGGRVEVIGSGVVGLCCAEAFAARGAAVRLISASRGPDQSCCSWWAGGMLAPYCEMETAEPLIGALGEESMAFWREQEPKPVEAGTLVVASVRDRSELTRFEQRTIGWRRVAAPELETLEPDVAERFSAALFFQGESHMDPRAVLPSLLRRLEERGVDLQLGRRLESDALTAAPDDVDWRIDCRGLAARDQLPALRGVRGEMLMIRSLEVRLTRTVRLLHPRYSLYIVPRGDGVYMVGATQIESDARGGPTVRSALELLSAAYALHPAFGEAEILEIGVDVRPAFADNLPRLLSRGRTLYVNGMFRHGFLAAPAMARRAADHALDGAAFPEVTRAP